MRFAAIVDRVRHDFLEAPHLELTLPQAIRLWDLGMDDCRYVIDALVDAGFLRWTPGRTIVRTAREFRTGPRGANASYVSVRAAAKRHRSV